MRQFEPDYPLIKKMKQYPSISREIQEDMEVYVFEKLDGSNIRAEWSPKMGFYKFGTRKRLLGDDDPMFGEALGLIRKQGEILTDIFKSLRFENAIAYFEFLGANSFAGLHEKEPHKVVLIDVDVYKKGFMTPVEFLRAFEGRTNIPKFLYYGKIDKQIETTIRSGNFPGASFEGVVCKSNPPRTWSLPVMFKIKNQAWINRVVELHGNKSNLEDFL